MWPFASSSKARDALPPAPHPLPEGVTSADQCPVDESTRKAWLDSQRKNDNERGRAEQSPPLVAAAMQATNADTVRPMGAGAAATAAMATAVEARRVAALSKEREVSSIPRGSRSGYNGGEGDGGEHLESSPSQAISAHPSSSESAPSGNWVYPSPAQFYSAMARKNHNPTADDMPIVVSIHNAVNERAWQEIIAWERGWAFGSSGGRTEASSLANDERLRSREPAEECGGLKLVSFTGKPKQLTWRAWGRTLLGYSPPFDRHDWVIDRCGNQVRYIIDFYTGRPTVAARPSPNGEPVQNLAFYLDVRPAPDSVQGWAMRVHRSWLRLLGHAPLPGAS
ncbi:Cytochrome c1 heme lyase [Tilletia horrida]|uniref:Holocytochrome c-type synthase n=1 Tax=Tilletia horrida TaxID=155126 RepID=A0AAN6GMM3_9BASI|nr:Cytochrome c1 heme lyase [Tilletia horrida]KAK0563505.1 Cytochrome c1 heme lyase [Tilletia horrida]